MAKSKKLLLIIISLILTFFVSPAKAQNVDPDLKKTLDSFSAAIWQGLWEALWMLLKNFWPYLLILLVIYFVREWLPILIERRRREEKFSALKSIYSDRELLSKLQHLKPSEFEEFIAYMFKSRGFKTELTGSSHDGGIDVIAEKKGIKHYIQCKKYITSKVGVGAMRDFYGALIDHLAGGKGYFITTNIFTSEAENFAQDKPVELLDGQRLVKYIHNAGVEKEIPALTEKSKTIELERCPVCGGALIEKNGKYGKFLGCSNYPKCRFTKNL